MSVAATTAPAAGWYPDPTEPERLLRWWDGNAWSAYTTDVPQPEPEPETPQPFANVVVDLAPGDEVPDAEPIEFSWSDPEDLFEVTVAEYEPDPVDEATLAEAFTFRARPTEATEAPAIEIPSLPVYESPLETIASPLSVRVEVPVRIEPPAPVGPQTAAAPAPAVPAPPAPAPGRRRLAVAGTGAVVAVAAAAALLTNVLSGDDSAGRASTAAPALTATDKGCLRVWNTTASPSAGQLRVTVGQFEGALARVSQVAPLPGTVMAPNSCALTVYDPATDTHAIFVAGVKDQIGYIDVTSYPRAERYGWPKTTGDANVTIRPDGSIRAL
jgi:hypothetical protein